MSRRVTVGIGIAACLFAVPDADSFGQTIADVEPPELSAPEPIAMPVDLTARLQRPRDGWKLDARVFYAPIGAELSRTMTSEYLPWFSVTDNNAAGLADRDNTPGRIRVEIPRHFEEFGTYFVDVRGSSAKPRVIYTQEGGDSLYRRIREWLRGLGDGLLGSDGIALQWTPTSPRQYVASRPWDLNIATLPGPDDASPEILWTVPMAQTPTWSPNGEMIVCSAWQQQRWRLNALDARTGETLWRWDGDTPAGATDTTPVFNEAGNQIAFLRVEGRNSDVWALELDEERQPGRPRRLTDVQNVSRVVLWTEATGLLIESSITLAADEGEDGQASVLAQVDPEAGIEKRPILVESPIPGEVLASFAGGSRFLLTEPFQLGLDRGRELIMFSDDNKIRSMDLTGSWARVSPNAERFVYTAIKR